MSNNLLGTIGVRNTSRITDKFHWGVIPGQSFLTPLYLLSPSIKEIYALLYF